MSDTSVALLKELTEADGVPGHEEEIRDIFRRELQGIGAIATDRVGGIYCTRSGGAPSPRVMIDSHLDEVGFIVQRVTADGFVKFLNLGGWWTHTLPSQRVRIKTSRGKISGVIGSTPPHLLEEEEKKKVREIRELFIDVGAESDRQAEEELGIRPGCPIAPAADFTPLGGNKMFAAKAFDNRCGVGLVIESLKQLGEHPNTVIGVGCAQEELGLRGARVAARIVKPDVALVMEGSPADDVPGLDPEARQGRLGGGVQIRMFDPSMIANARLAELAIQTADEADIPYQLAVRHSGGTNAGAIHLAECGVPAVVLGVPARYIHSHHAVIDIDDYRAALRLLLALIPRLDEKTAASLC